MRNQLDEHLTKDEIKLSATFFPLLPHLFLYLLFIGFLGAVLYYIIEHSNFPPFISGDILNNIKAQGIRFICLLLLFLIPGYILQRKTFELYHQSIVRSAVVPVAFLNIFLTISIISVFWNGEDNGESIWYIIGIYGAINSWIISLSLFISWYFAHQKKWLFGLCLSGHWIIYSIIMGFLVR